MLTARPETSYGPCAVAVTLIVSTAGREPQSITLDLPRIVLGRGAHADVRLPSRAVSELHAVLHNDKHEVAIVDEGSTNGTRVNGQPLPRGRRKVLHDGDVITVPPFVLRVSVGVARPDPPERTASLARRLLLDAVTTRSDEAAPPRLVLLTSKLAGSAWMLPPVPSRVVIGREPGCEVLLDDRECSKQHAEVLRDAEGVIVRDLGSRNGIVIAGRAVSERRLRHGDEFVVGRTGLRYHDPTEELLRSFETGADEPPPEMPDEPLSQIEPEGAPHEESVASDEAAPDATASTAPDGSATDATSGTSARPASTSAKPALVSAKPLKPRGNFDWIVVVIAVIVLVVSVSALVLLLSGRM